jgi:predicted ABC-type ATPase
VDFFNADDRAAQLESGIVPGHSAEHPRSGQPAVRVIRERLHRAASQFRAGDHPSQFHATFDQAATARREGFFVEMHYLALTNFAQHVERVKIRADKQGHSAPESVLRGIYDSSLRNLARAIREMDAIAVYDNGEQDTVPRVLLQAEGGQVVYIAGQHPEWLEQVLAEL